MKTFDDVWVGLAIPGEFDAMDQCDQARWRSVLEQAFEEGRSAGAHILASERERCASIADSMRIEGPLPDSEESAQDFCARYIADEIRGKP